ncbi:MAG TPA: pyruvate formate lyase family protein [Anaerovoracaceae bacterium]|nr:pyruvate formate lyase family protein [Anaerovoracaceae bacterium]
MNEYIKGCEENIAKTLGGSKDKQEKIDFWNASIIICSAVIRFAARYADRAEELLRKGAKMVQQGMANPGFFNDKVGIPIVLSKGATIEEARDWAIVGCIRPQAGGGTADGSPDAGYVNAPKVLELVLHNGIDPRTGEQIDLQTGDPSKFTSREELIDAVKKQMVYFYEMIRDGYNIMVPNHMLRLPVIFASLVMEGCIQNGKSVQEGGTKYKIRERQRIRRRHCENSSLKIREE